MTPTFGGRPITISPSLAKRIEEAGKAIDHDHYGLWESYISMQVYRARAIATWTRRESLIASMWKASDQHPDVPKARDREQGLYALFLDLEMRFLQAESDANTYWVALGEAKRAEMEADTMIGVPASQEAILGLWRHPLGSSPLPPEGMRIEPTVLQFCPASQARAYKGGI